MNALTVAQRALALAARRNPDATAEELMESAVDIIMDWRRDDAEEREHRGVEDSPCLQSCDFWGTGEGRYHGVIS
jgi:hypothetical protein